MYEDLTEENRKALGNVQNAYDTAMSDLREKYAKKPNTSDEKFVFAKTRKTRVRKLMNTLLTARDDLLKDTILKDVPASHFDEDSMFKLNQTCRTISWGACICAVLCIMHLMICAINNWYWLPGFIVYIVSSICATLTSVILPDYVPLCKNHSKDKLIKFMKYPKGICMNQKGLDNAEDINDEDESVLEMLMNEDYKEIGRDHLKEDILLDGIDKSIIKHKLKSERYSFKNLENTENAGVIETSDALYELVRDACILHYMIDICNIIKGHVNKYGKERVRVIMKANRCLIYYTKPSDDIIPVESKVCYELPPTWKTYCNCDKNIDFSKIDSYFENFQNMCYPFCLRINSRLKDIKLEEKHPMSRETKLKLEGIKAGLMTVSGLAIVFANCPGKISSDLSLIWQILEIFGIVLTVMGIYHIIKHLAS